LLARIDQTNDADEPTKTRLRDAVKESPAHALKTLTTKALEAGLSRISDFAHRIGHVIHTTS